MPDTVEVRQPTVTVDDEATDSLSVSWTVPVSGGMAGSPYAKYSTHKSGGTSAENPTADELIAKVAEGQTAMFEAPAEKTVTLNDGVADTTFTGFDTGPHHSIAYGGVDNGRTVVHRCARLDFINTAIYIGQYGRAGFMDENEGVEARTISELLQVVLENIITNFEAYSGEADSTLDPTAQAVRDLVHTTNKELIDDWYAVLYGSREVTLDGIDAFLQDDVSRFQAAEAVAAVYMSSSTDFFSKIAQFESMFQMRFIPDATGEQCGRFISFKDVVSNAEDKTVNIRSISISAGPKSFLPVTGIVVTGLPRPAPYNTKEDTVGTSVCSWPETLPSSGSILTVTAPNWIPSEILPERDAEGESLTPEENASYLSDADAAAKDIYENVKTVVADFARCVYCNVSLGSSQASIQTILDVTWEVGKRYAVTQDGGSKLFDGFLCGLEHRVTSTPDRVEATTSLTFSHIEAEGFTLPNK